MRALFLLFSSALFLSTITHAGTMGSAPSFDGFLLGVGGGYVNTNLSKWTDVTMFSTFPAVTEYYREDNIKNSFAPIANASYFKALPEDRWYWGVKGLYKYLGIQHPRLDWNGTFQNGTYQEAAFHTKVVQEFFLTLDAAYQIFDTWLVYLGIGPSISEFQSELRGELLPSTSVLFQYTEKSRSKALWGVAGQLGFNLMLPNRFMLDFSYNLVVTPKGRLPGTYFYTETSGFYSRFSQQVNLLEQGLNITVNKYFG